MKSFLASLGIFTKIKVKNNVFEENNGPACICWFAFTGAICGGFTALIYELCVFFNLKASLSAVMLLLSLYFVSGFLHLDGFMDCADSLLSARDKEGKIKILKDSTVGAFSVITVCLCLILEYSSLTVIYSEKINVLLFPIVPFISRALCALFLLTFHPFEDKGMLVYFQGGKKNRHVLICSLLLVCSLALTYFLCGLISFIVLFTASVLTFAAVKITDKIFGGINGDVIGAGVIFFEAAAYFMLALAI